MFSRERRLAVIFFLLTALLTSACTHVTRETTPPKVQLIGVVLQEAQLFEQRYQLTLRLQNPNEYEIKVRGLDFNVDLNGDSFAQGVANNSVILPGYGETIAKVSVSSNILTLMRQLSDNNNDISYRIYGRINLDNIPLPVSFESEGRLDDFIDKLKSNTKKL